MQKTYKSLDKLVRNLILDTIGIEKIDLISAQGRLGSAGGETVYDQSLTGLVDALVSDLRQMVKPWIRYGLDITASDPVNSQITISSGAGYASGRKYVLNRTITTVVPFEDNIALYYVNLWDGKIDIETAVPANKLNIGKIIVPEPGTTSKIQDDKDTESIDNINAYIVSAKDLFFDDTVILDDNSRAILKDAMGNMHFSQLTGDLILTENIRVRNASNTLTIDSNSIKIFYDDSEQAASVFNRFGTFYFNEDGDEFARYTKNDARIGNISILPNSIQSVNFITNVSGFRIQDNGDAEFNDVKLRGTLYTSTIAENIYIQAGVYFIGDLNFSESNITLDSGYKIIFDGIGGDTYWVYNEITGYLEGWVDGTKRIEL